VAATAEPEPVIVCGRAKSGGADLRALLPELLAETRGKGGGSPDLVQIAPGDPTLAEPGSRWLAARLEGAGANAERA
jgi:hypothetical protein